MIRAAFRLIRRAYWRQQVAARCAEYSEYSRATIRPGGWNVQELQRLERRAIAAQVAYGRAMACHDGKARA